MIKIPRISLVSLVPNDVKQTAGAIKNGWQTGKKYTLIHDKSLPTDIFIRSKAVYRNVKREKCGLPALLAAVCLPVPVPGACIVGYGVGVAIKKLAKFIR